MKLKRKRAVEVPPKIRLFINSVISTPLESIAEPLRSFVWDFDKGDFHQWVDLFNHFDSFFDKYIKSRKDLQVEDNFLGSDPPFPKDAVLQILRVIRIILENCTNKHFYSSYEQHLSSLLASTDADVVEACLQTLAAFLKKAVGKYVIRDSGLHSKLFAFAQGWGGKEEGLGLVACAIQDGSDQVSNDLGSTLHFEFYADDTSNAPPASEQPIQGLQIIHLPNVNSYLVSDIELLHKLVVEYKVPPALRFFLLTRLRFARAFSSLASRQQYTCVRLYAFMVLVQSCSDTEDLVSFFNTEPEFINELVTLLSYEDAVPEKIRILSLLCLVALCQDRSRQPSVLIAVTSGGHRGILSSLMQKAIDSVSSSSKWSVIFAEALLSLVTVLVSSSSGCSAMREAGFIPTLLPLLKDTDPQHLHLVSTAVHVLEAFMDYSNPAAALFRDLGGLDDTISRLKVEVSYVENLINQQGTSVASPAFRTEIAAASSSELDSGQPLYSEALVASHRRSLMKALLRAISLGTYAPGSTSRIYGSEECLLPLCLCIIFRKAKEFGGGVFSLASTVMSDLIHKDPTCFSVLEAAGLPSAFLDAIMEGVLCSAEAITCIPQCLDALCLSNNGLQAVRDRGALRCFVKIFTSKMYLRVLTGDTPGSLSNGLDELMRHASSLRVPGVEMLIEILNAIAKLGSSSEVSHSSNDSQGCSTPVLMVTDQDEQNQIQTGGDESCQIESSEKLLEPTSDALLTNIEWFLPEYITNATRLLETVLQNSDACRIFIERKGTEAVLQFFRLPLMPLSASVGQSISAAFKNFSPQHSASLVRAVCLFLREHLKLTHEVLSTSGGTHFVQLEVVNLMKLLRCLAGLEGIVSVCTSLLKSTTVVISELATSDADVLKELGRVYREIHWQISLCSDIKVDEKQNVTVESENADASVSTTAGRESDDDVTIPVVRYMNPVSARNNSHPQWGIGRDFLSVVRSGEGFSRRSRHGLARIRGGRTSRHLETLQMDSEVTTNSIELPSSIDMKKKSPEVLTMEILKKLSSTLRCFFVALVKGFTVPNRRRSETGSLGAASKSIGTALAKLFLEAFGFSTYSTSAELSLSVKCRYLGKVVDDMTALVFDNRRRTCYTAMINNFYVHGTFKELLTTFEATSQLLWTLPYALPQSTIEHENSSEGGKLAHNSWLVETLLSYCRVLEYFVNSTLLLSPASASQAQLLVQPVAVGLSIGLFPVPRDPEVFVRMLQSQVLDVILPIWNHAMFPNCNPGFISSVVSLVTHIYSGVGDAKKQIGGSGSTNQRLVAPPPDESTIATIIEMGFTRARAEEALRHVGTNSVEMAMEWLFSHVEDPVQEDDELARALALSLGNSSEMSKVDNTDKPVDDVREEGPATVPPVDDILASAMKLLHTSDTMAFPLTDLLITLCSRNKGEDRAKVTAYLTQQLKLCPLQLVKDSTALCMVSHTLALLLNEDGNSRDIAAHDGIAVIAIDFLINFKARIVPGNELVVPKCITSLLLILDILSQSKPKIPSQSTEGNRVGSLPDSTNEPAPIAVPEHASEIKSAPEEVVEKKSAADSLDGGIDAAIKNIFGSSTGYLTFEDSSRLLVVSCELIKLHVPPLVMQALLQLCARLTKTHSLALQFLEFGGLVALFNIPISCFFPGYDTVASAIIRHLIEDPQTLQTAMELEIRQTLSGNRNAGRVPVRAFLTSMAPVISRDPGVFMRAAASVCQLESSGGRTFVVLSKEKEKERDKSKARIESGALPNECVKISESKTHDVPGKCAKGHKKFPANLVQVIDQLLEILMRYPAHKCEEDCTSYPSAMEVDESLTKVKGKTKVDDTRKTESNTVEKSAGLAKVTFVLKLLSDILLMYVHAVGVILKRDAEICQLRGLNVLDSAGHCGILHHVLNYLVPPSVDKTCGPDEWRVKLSEKASWFLVVLCGRSSEGRRRVISEIVKTLKSLSNLESNSSRNNLWPDKKVLSFVDLVYSILSKNSSSSNLPGTGCSPDIAKSMIDGGIVQCLSSILQVMDLDHPDASEVVNLILKALEILTRAAHAGEQLFKSETLDKKKFVGSGQNSGNQVNATLGTETVESDQNHSLHQSNSEGDANQQPEGSAQRENDLHSTVPNQSLEQDMRIEVDETVTSNTTAGMGIDFMRDEMEDGDMINNADQIEMTFHVENREDNDMGEEDDDMGVDGEDDEDDDEGEDDEEDLGEDGTALMSLADTDVEDHDEAALGDDYNDDMVDEDEDDFHENRVIEVRWREALDGLDHLQVLGQPGVDSGLIDVAAEPFEGVNVDDLFGLRRPMGFDRRRQTSRNSLERSTMEGNGLQHPFLLRASQSSDLASTWSSGGNSSRDLESLSAGSFDVAHLYMFDAPVLPYDNVPSGVFGERLSSAAAPTLADFSVGLESLRVPGRRAPGAGRWTDDGYPQVGSQAATVAQAVEEQFIYQLRGNAPSENPPEIQSNNSESPEKHSDGPLISDSQIAVRIDGSEAQQSEDQHCESDHETALESNQIGESVAIGVEAGEDILDSTSNIPDNMDIGEGNDIAGEPRLMTTTDISQDSRQFEITSEIQQTDVPFQDLNNDGSATVNSRSNLDTLNLEMSNPGHGDYHGSSAHEDDDIDMNGSQMEENPTGEPIPSQADGEDPPLMPNLRVAQDTSQIDESRLNSEPANANGIDPTFLEALPEELRAEVLASQQAQPSQPPPAPTYAQPTAEEIDPEFLAALPPDIQAEVLAQQRAQRVAQQAEGQPVEMDNASIIATFPPDLREEVLLTSSEAVLSALPSPLLAEAQMLRDRAMSHYQAHSLFGNNHRHTHRRNGLGFDRQAVMDRGVGVTIGRRTSSVAEGSKLKEVEGEPLLDANALKALIRLLRLAQPLGKGLLQRLLLNLCAHSCTRANLIRYLLDMINPGIEGSSESSCQRLYGCQSNVVYGRSQLLHGLPPLVLRRVLEIMTYLATNHSAVANILFYFDPSIAQNSLHPNSLEMKTDKGKEKMVEDRDLATCTERSIEGNVPLILLLKLLSQPLFLRSVAHLEQVMGLLQVVVFAAASKLDSESCSEPGGTSISETLSGNAVTGVQDSSTVLERESNSSGLLENQIQSEGELALDNIKSSDGLSTSVRQKSSNTRDIFLQLPQSDLHSLCSLLGHEGLSDKVYLLAGEVLKKLALVIAPHRKFFILELSELAHNLSSSAVSELVTLRNTQMLGLSAGSMAGAAILRVLQTLSSLTSPNIEGENSVENDGEREELATMWKLNISLDPLWQELSNCISATESQLAQSSVNSIMSNTNVGEQIQGTSSLSPLPPGTQRLLPFIEAFLVLCEKLQAKSLITQQDHANSTAREVKEFSGSSASFSIKCGMDSLRRLDGAITFMRFAEKHRRLLNAFVRQNPSLLEKSLSMILKAPRLIDFDNKRAYFRSRIRQQHEQHISGPLRVGVRRAYVLEDSYNQLRMRPTQDLKGRLNVHFQGEEGIDAGGLTREWYQLLSRVIFDKGALLFTTGGNNATFQPNPNSVYQTEHLSYFKFVGRVVAKALYDGQLLDVYFTRSFYKHILGVKVTYHDIEAVDPDYYKNLKWMLENDVSEIPDLTFSMDADEEKHILYEKTEVTEHELKPGGGNIRVTEETKHEYVDLVAEHILTNAIRPQINSFLEGFNELIPRELISIFNDKELELLISGLPEIDLDDLKANTEYTGYTVASHVVQWFWEVVKTFNKEDTARFLQFVTGTSKVPLEGFKALQGISGPQKFQIHKAYGAPERLPSAHTCFNQLDLPEYTSKEQLQERMLLAIHEASEGFGFG